MFEGIDRTDCWVDEVERVAETKIVHGPPHELCPVVDSNSLRSGPLLMMLIRQMIH